MPAFSEIMPPFLILDEQSDGLNLLFDGQQAKALRWKGGQYRFEQSSGTCFGFVQQGSIELHSTSGSFSLKAGMYFAAPQYAILEGQATVLLIEQSGHLAFFHLGGPVEDKGRLRYIDGCTDSLLIAPPVLGDPCLNLLHIPPHTFQSQHTHPSFRVGIIVGGKGQCVTPNGNTDLLPGLAFVIPAEGIHSFVTAEEPLQVIAYHPDSDFGPTHENHPMLNRTFLS